MARADERRAGGRRSDGAGDEPLSPREAIHALGDRALVEAMRRGDERAWGEFCGRFEPAVVLYARQRHIDPSEWNELAFEVLHDLALAVTRPGAAIPRDIRGYLAEAIRRRLLDRRTDATALDARHAHGSEHHDFGDDCSAVVTGAVSEHGLRLAYGSQRPPASAAVSHLAALLAQRMTVEERQILEWRAAGVPVSTIAEWLGRPFRATSKRIDRLRARLRTLARAESASLAPEERRRIELIFRRVAGVGGGRRGAAGEEESRERGSQPDMSATARQEEDEVP